MAEKRIIEQTPSDEIYSDDWFLKDSPTQETSKILGSDLKDAILDGLDTEVEDIRVGADGTSYASAGDAVRGQIRKINNNLDGVIDVILDNPITIPFLDNERVGYTLLENNTWLSQSNGGFIYSIPENARVLNIKANANAAASFGFLTSNDFTVAPQYAGGSGFTTVETNTEKQFNIPNGALYIFVNRRPAVGNTLLTPSSAAFIGYLSIATDINSIKSSISKKFYATYETIDAPQTIEGYNGHHLSLIATKKDNSFNIDNEPIQTPQDIGFLYADEYSTPQKLYYSANKYDNPIYLCDWKSNIVNDRSINIFCPFITRDGDIIFLMQGKQQTWANPVIYPHGDYNNPYVIELNPNDGYLPAGITTDAQVCVSFSDNFILFCDYHRSGDSTLVGAPMRIWKVTAPFTNPENWRVVLTKYYTITEPTQVDNNITHWHTVTFDRYTGRYYANTGDFSKSCQVYESSDKGETWQLVAADGQQWRALGYVFTQNGCYWGTDASEVSKHALYFAERDNNGVVDFSTTVKLANCKYDYIQGLTNLQRTYNTCLCRDPEGILLLDRAEERYDGLLNLEFYSFEDNTMHLIDVLHNMGGSEQTRYGFGNYAVTQYQNVEENGIICGSMNYERVFSLDMLNNSISNRVGVTKITIHRVNN